jgi:uncharacterized membrane protein
LNGLRGRVTVEALRGRAILRVSFVAFVVLAACSRAPLGAGPLPGSPQPADSSQTVDAAPSVEGADAMQAAGEAWGADASQAADAAQAADASQAADAAQADSPAATGDATSTPEPMPAPPPVISTADCPCHPGGGVEVLACGPAMSKFSGRVAPDAIMTPDGGTVAMSRCIPATNGGCGSALYLWTRATGTLALSDDAWPFALSDDGSTLLAERDPHGTGQVFLRKGGSSVDLPFLIAPNHLLSADGTVVVSQLNMGANVGEAARWTSADGLVGLGDLAGGYMYSAPLSMSADGSAVVGYGNTVRGQEPFLWTAAQGEMSDLGVLPNAPATGVQTIATTISRDGQIVVGTSLATDGTWIFRWSAADLKMVKLGPAYQLDPIAPGLLALSPPQLLLSADGAVTTGTARADDPMFGPGPSAFRWTQADGFVTLVPGSASVVRGASADGRRALGAVVTFDQTSTSPLPAYLFSPFVWDDAGGARDVAPLLAQGGAALSGVVLGDPIALSADGKVVVGHATCGGSEIVYRATLPD